MSTAKRVTAAIAAKPGVTVDELLRSFPELTRRRLGNALQYLREGGWIEATDGGYRVWAPPEPRTRAPAGAGQVVPMSKLMAGR